MSFLKSAKFVNDVELGADFVEVEYTKYVVGENRYDTFVDYFRTTISWTFLGSAFSVDFRKRKTL